MKTFLVVIALLMLCEMFRNLHGISQSHWHNDPGPRNRYAFAACVNTAILTWAACLLFL